MSTTPYYYPEFNDCFLGDNNTNEKNVIDSCILQKQLISSTTFYQSNSYDSYSYYYHHQHQDSSNANSQNLPKLFDACIDNPNNESITHNLIDFNLFDMNNYSPSPSILSLINNSHNLSSLSPLPVPPLSVLPFQSNVHTPTNTDPFVDADNNPHQTIDLSAFKFETNSTCYSKESVLDIDTTTVIRPTATTTTSTITDDSNTDKNRTSMVVTAIPMNCPYPPTSMMGLIAEHDRPFAKYGHLNHEMIQHRCRFDLVGIKTATKRFLNNNRMSRKMYAITCHTDIDQEYILNEICQQFPMPILQYVCVSSATGDDQSTTATTTLPTLYIQIILKKVVNKNGWFLDKITGDQCNYHVTNNDLAWNEFIKQDRRFIEIGLFKSMTTRSRLCYWPSSAFVRAQKTNLLTIHHHYSDQILCSNTGQ